MTMALKNYQRVLITSVTMACDDKEFSVELISLATQVTEGQTRKILNDLCNANVLIKVPGISDKKTPVFNYKLNPLHND